MGDKVPIPRSEGRGRPSGARANPADVSRPGCSDRRRTRRQGSRAHTRIESPDVESIGSDEDGKRTVVAQIAGGVCASAEEILGEALLGAGIFLCDERSDYGRADSRLHRRTRPGATRSGLHGRRMSFSRLPEVIRYAPLELPKVPWKKLKMHVGRRSNQLFPCEALAESSSSSGTVSTVSCWSSSSANAIVHVWCPGVSSPPDHSSFCFPLSGCTNTMGT